MISTKELSRVALGTMQFLWTTQEEEANDILDTYYNLGGNIVDTADMYANWVEGLSGGEAETIVGKWMKRKNNRDSIFLTTKVGAKMWEGNDGGGLSKKHIIKAIEKSLKRLQTDYLDLYLAHWSDANTPIEETLLAFQSLIKEGKVRSIGCSNYTNEELITALQIGERLDIKYSYIQAYYNLLDKRTYEEQYLPLAQQYNLKVMIYGPLAGGFLSGIYRKNKPLPKHARAEFIKEKMTTKNLALIDYLEDLSDKYNASVSQISLAWLISKGYIPIVGADTTLQVGENLDSTKIELRQNDIDILNKL